MAPTLKAPGTHFSELLSKHYNCELLALSRGGCSNATICLQIEQAVSMDADFIIIGSTTPQRIEIPINDSKLKNVNNAWHLPFSFDTIEIKQYNKERGLANISYARHPDLSANNDFLREPVLISETINNLIDGISNDFYNLDAETIRSLKYYIANLYDNNFKRQMDCWMINSILRKLKYETNINFLFFPHILFIEEYAKDIKWLEAKHIITDGPYELERSDLRYHTTPEAQIVVAEEVKIKINQLSH